MRWLWLTLVLCVGCGRPAVSEVAVSSDKPNLEDARWVIRGNRPANILLTNGSFGVWVNTATLQFADGAFRFVDGRLYELPAWSPIMEVSLAADENTWSFDLRTGELVSFARIGRREQSARVTLHPERPVIAFEVKGGPATGTLSAAKDFVATPLIEDEGVPLSFKLRVDRSGLAGFFAKSEDDGLPVSYAEVRSAGEAIHREFWKTDIEIDGPAEDQLAIRTMLYYVRRGATDKLPPFGASNAKYRGARFWDAEAWMLPVLAIVDPDRAKSATKWRIENLGDYVPWEAALDGRDVTPKEFGNALHVAGWVSWWTRRAWELGLATREDEKRVLDAVFAQFYRAASDSGSGMEIKNVESPDEGRLRDNDLVTNLLAKHTARWAADHEIADGEDLDWFNSIVIPKSADGIPATYDNDLIKGYQQTAALLAIYPLHENFGPGVADKMFDRYADLTSEVGPAMSESIHATIAARLGRKDAYNRWRKSWQTYTDDAMMFHERRNKQDAYFMTGAAGCLQTVLYGFAGLRLPIVAKESAMGYALKDGYSQAFRPSLPSEWKSITLRNVYLGRKRVIIRIDHSGAIVE